MYIQVHHYDFPNKVVTMVTTLRQPVAIHLSLRTLFNLTPRLSWGAFRAQSITVTVQMTP